VLNSFRNDLRDACRILRKQPLFALVVSLALGLGIGANTTIFSVVNSVLLRPLNYERPEQLFVIHEIIPQWAKSYPVLNANLPDFELWRKQARSFEDIAVAEASSMVLTESGDAAELACTRSSANLLHLLGARPALGRLFLPEEDNPGTGKSVVLTDSFWRNRFHADPSIIDRAITLDGVTYAVVGVLPASFRLPGGLNGFSRETKFFIPLDGPKSYEQDLIGEFDFTAIGRLKSGVTAATAAAELNVIQAQILKESHVKDIDLRAEIILLQAQIVAPARLGLSLLLAAVGALLLMICVNVANLYLSRVPGRLRDAAIRKALGASSAGLVRSMFVESLLLVTVGGLLGVLLARFLLEWLAELHLDIPRAGETHLDLSTAAFVILVCVGSAALFGTLPAWLVARADLREILASSGNTATAGSATGRLRTALVGFEVATCTVLLIVAGLLSRSLLHLLYLDPGFDVEHVLTADVTLPPVAYKQPSLRDGFFREVLDHGRKLPGVQSVGWVSILPLEGEGSVSGINLPGRSLSPEQAPIVNYRVVSPDYFVTVGIPVLSGRAFSQRDRGRRQVIVSQALAHRLWPNKNPVGEQCIALWARLQDQPSEVIGVAGDVRNSLDQPPLNMVYVADSWTETQPGVPSSASFVVRTTGDPAALGNALRVLIHQQAPDVPIVALRPMSQLVALNVDKRRLQALLTGLFALSALLLAALGIFAVLAYSVEQRRREMAIRVALGAQRTALLRMTMRQGMLPAVAGLAIGIAASFASGSMLRSLIVGVSALDPLTFCAVAALICVVAVIACFIPARRAMSVDPLVALRWE
jgi:putative ABC transport system permease protein